jgi:hypothetical protein
MSVELRAPAEDEWDAILSVAHDAAPWAGEANATWLANRRQFDENRYGRRHHVATEGEAIVGYGAIEGDGSRRWRVFVVMAPERLENGTGDLVFRRLMRDLRELGATSLWMREEARDTAIQSFATRRGFTEQGRFEFQRTEIVMLERAVPSVLEAAMPSYDVHEVHELIVRAPIDVVYEAARGVTVGEIRLLGPLMFLRMLPARLRGRPVALGATSRVIDVFRDAGFALLGETPGREIALGAIGRFWSISGNNPIAGIETAEQFASFETPGYAKAALNIVLADAGANTRVVTETRVVSTSADAKKSFGRYWLLIRLPSGAIRRSWLEAIKRRAMSASPSGSSAQ